MYFDHSFQKTSHLSMQKQEISYRTAKNMTAANVISKTSKTHKSQQCLAKAKHSSFGESFQFLYNILRF